MATSRDIPAVTLEVSRGTAIGRYLVLAEVGRGGMGVVYAAFDPDLDRHVALKLLPVVDDQSSQHLGREARVLAKLAHPNVASVFDVGLTDQWLYIAMELVEGGDLGAWLEQQPRSSAEIVSVFVDAGRGLAAAHAKGLVHRDFKPANVLMGTDGRVRVADFGLARLDLGPSSLGPGETMRGLADTEWTLGGGTPGFIAPEVLDGHPPKASADQYAFCVSLLACLTGSMPQTRSELEAQLASGSLPRRARRAIAKGLSPRPEDRFESMDALLGVLAAGPRQRARLAGAVGLGLLGGGALAWTFIGGAEPRTPPAEPTDPCAAGQASLETTWNEARSSALRSALTTPQTAFATNSTDRVLDALDAQAQAWSTAHASVCAQPSDEPQTVGRLRCLGDRLLEFDALLVALSESDEAVLDEAVAAVASLRSPDFCTDPKWRPPPPQLTPPPTIAAEVDALRPLLEQGAAYEVTGQFDRAREELDTVVAQAKSIGYAPMLAEAQYQVGMVLMEQGRYAEAETALRSSFAAALQSGHDEILLEGAALLLYATGASQGDMDSAQVWDELAVATVARVGPGNIAEASYWESAGAVARRKSELPRAQECFERALTIRRELLPADHPSTTVPLSLLAGLSVARRDFVSAERQAREVLALRSKLLGDDHPNLISDHITLASALTPQDKPDEAIEHLERAFELGLGRLSPKHPRRLAAHGSLASALNRLGKHERARVLYSEILAAHEVISGLESVEVGLSHHNLATTLHRLGQLDAAIEHHHRAVETMSAVLGPTHPKVAVIIDGLAVTLEVAGRCDEALAANTQAQAIVEAGQEPGAPIHPQTPFAANTRAVIYLCQGDGHKALAAARHAVKIAEAAPGEARSSLGTLLVTRARAELATGDIVGARVSAERATHILTKDVSTSMVRARLVLAEVARQQGDRAEAERFAADARKAVPLEGPRRSQLLRQLDDFDAQ